MSNTDAPAAGESHGPGEPHAAHDLKDRLLAAILPNVPFDGWNDQVLDTAALKLGVDPALARNAFPRGVIDVIAYHSEQADRALLDAMAAQDLTGLGLSARVALAVRTRLEQAEDTREAVRRAVSLLALPQNGLLTARLLFATVSVIWAAVGDRSTDFSYYTKRATLAAVYSATLTYWLQDDTPGREKTWPFLDRRLAEVVLFGKAKAKVKAAAAHLPSPLDIAARLREAVARARGGD